MPCDHCAGVPPLCGTCAEAAIKPLLRKLRPRALRWGLSVYRRRPDGTWPSWDADTTGRLRATARRLVRDMHPDARVFDRLARTCAYEAGEAYRNAIEQARRDREAQARRELRAPDRWRGSSHYVGQRYLIVETTGPPLPDTSSQGYSMQALREAARERGDHLRVVDPANDRIVAVFDREGNPTTLEAVNAELAEEVRHR
jgi:hypothetical protein